MDRMGVDYPTLMFLARWGSAVILRHLAESPLLALAAKYKRGPLVARRGSASMETDENADVVPREVLERFAAAAAGIKDVKEALTVLTDALTAKRGAFRSSRNEGAPDICR